MRLRLGIVALALTASFVAAPSVATAIEVPRVYVASVDYVAGTVVLGVQHDAETRQLSLETTTSFVASLTCDAASQEETLPAYRLTSRQTLRVIGEGEDGVERWELPITLDPADYRPARPTLSVALGKVVPSRWSFSGTDERPVTFARATEIGSWRTYPVVVAPASNSFKFPSVRVPFGRAVFKVVVANGFGASPRRYTRVYNLGTDLPRRSRYELISKRILWMFDVRSGRVIHEWPVAIGTPQTPTPTGTFKVGGARPGGGDWGVLRRRLSRLSGGQLYPTRYYIHGTNAPWSIGTPASHGCVRMYNRDVRQFARVVPNGTVVRIR